MVKATTTSIWRAAAVFGAIVGGTMPLAANEVLPWANTPPTVATAEPAVADPAREAALAQCTPLFEAACRDLSTCAWIADVSLQDGTVLPARCVARPSAPPKSAAKKTPAPKKKTAETPKAPSAKPAAATAATETGAIPAKVEPKAAAAAPVVVMPPVAEKKAPAAPVPDAPVKLSAPAATPPPAAPVAQKQPAAAPPPAEKTAATAPAPKAEQAPKSPVSAKAPAPQGGGSMPGFGSFSSAFPAGGAIVTTTVPPKTSSQ